MVGNSRLASKTKLYIYIKQNFIFRNKCICRSKKKYSMKSTLHLRAYQVLQEHIFKHSLLIFAQSKANHRVKHSNANSDVKQIKVALSKKPQDFCANQEWRYARTALLFF